MMSFEPVRPSLVGDGYADEVRSVRQFTPFDLEIGVEIDAFAFDRRFDAPTPVYARPYSIIGGDRRDYPRAYCLGVRFPTGILEDATWELDMRADGVCEGIVGKCRRYLGDNAM